MQSLLLAHWGWANAWLLADGCVSPHPDQHRKQGASHQALSEHWSPCFFSISWEILKIYCKNDTTAKLQFSNIIVGNYLIFTFYSFAQFCPPLYSLSVPPKFKLELIKHLLLFIRGVHFLLYLPWVWTPGLFSSCSQEFGTRSRSKEEQMQKIPGNDATLYLQTSFHGASSTLAHTRAASGQSVEALCLLRVESAFSSPLHMCVWRGAVVPREGPENVFKLHILQTHQPPT